MSKVLKEYNPKFEAKMFGSSATGLYLPQSDIDIVVVLPKFEYKSTKQSGIKKFSSSEKSWNNTYKDYLHQKQGYYYTEIEKLRKYLEVQENIIQVESIIEAKVPLIKLVDAKTGLSMDISFNKYDGLAALKFIKMHLELYPDLKYILIFLKSFLKARGLGETFYGGMTSFTLTILAISYFQYIEKETKNADLLLSEHLLNFFNLFGYKFNYNELGISILKGGNFFQKLEKNWGCDYDNPNKPLSIAIENPHVLGL
jgi:non-canonical poly(A) RNA polymerase PAPD5/7